MPCLYSHEKYGLETIKPASVILDDNVVDLLISQYSTRVWTLKQFIEFHVRKMIIVDSLFDNWGVLLNREGTSVHTVNQYARDYL